MTVHVSSRIGPTAIVSADPSAPANRLELAPEASIRFRRVVEDHFSFIWRSLRGFGIDKAAADDAAQHVFWIAAQKLDEIAEGSERSFLFSTARGVAANHRRSQSRNREVADETALLHQIDASPDAEHALEERQARRLLDIVLMRLPEDLRTVFILFELEEMTMADIATLLNIPPGTVASRLRRARVEFQELTKSMRTKIAEIRR